MTRTTKEKIAVMQAFEDGKPIECINYGLGVWELCDDPSWDWLETDYRVAVTKPSWDWSHVNDKVNYLVRFPNGEGLGCEICPKIEGNRWRYFSGMLVFAENFASYNPGTCDWQDSLVVRPGYEENK